MRVSFRSSAREVQASFPQSLLLIVVFFLFWFDGGTADSCLRASPAGGQDESLADLYRKAPRGKGSGRRWRPGLTRASDVLDLDDLVGLGAGWGHHLDGVADRIADQGADRKRTRLNSRH